MKPMFIRFTVDAVAEKLVSGATEGEIDGKVLHKFLRKGRWAGRRGHDPEPFRQVLTAAVALASQKLTLEYLDEREELQATIARSTATVASLGDPIPDPEPVALAAPVGGSAVAGPSMDVSFTALSNTVSRERSSQVAAANAERQRSLESAIASKSVAESKIHSLQGTFTDRVLTAHELGKTLWARYCDGYDQKTKSTAGDTRRPGSDIAFEIPRSLTPPPSPALSDPEDNFHA